jgi:hypothetical protein
MDLPFVQYTEDDVEAGTEDGHHILRLPEINSAVKPEQPVPDKK